MMTPSTLTVSSSRARVAESGFMLTAFVLMCLAVLFTGGPQFVKILSLAATETPPPPWLVMVGGWLVSWSFFLWGAIGGLVAGCYKDKGFRVPRMVLRKDDDGQVIMWDPGFLLTAVGAGAVGHLIDGRPYTAFAFGAVIGIFGIEFFRKIAEKAMSAITNTKFSLKFGEEAHTEHLKREVRKEEQKLHNRT